MRKMLDPCESCQTLLGPRNRRVTVYRHQRGKHFIFEKVPARVCTGCGARYFSAQVVRTMDRQMISRRKRATVAVPVIAYRAAS